MLLSQIPGADKAIESATKEGWVVVLLVAIVLAICSLAGYLVRRILSDGAEREMRLSSRLSTLEDYIHATVVTILQDATRALATTNENAEKLADIVGNLSVALTNRPCFWSEEKQREIVERLKRGQ